MTKQNKPKLPANRIQIVPEGRKGWRWVVYYRGKPVAQSWEQYRRESDAARGAERFDDICQEIYFSYPIFKSNGEYA